MTKTELEEKIRQLRVYKKPTKTLMNKYPYYKYEEYRERMDQVFGPLGYSEQYFWEQPFVFPGTQCQVITIVKCRIAILDEEGNEVFVVEGLGNREVAKEKDEKDSTREKDAKFINLNNLALITQRQAFKSACSQLGIFGGAQAKNSDSSTSQAAANQASSSSNGNRNASKPERAFTVIEMLMSTESTFSVVRNDRNSTLPVRLLVGRRKADGKEARVLFYPNLYKEASGNVQMLDDAVGKKCFPLRLKVQTGNKDGEYIFREFVKNS